MLLDLVDGSWWKWGSFKRKPARHSGCYCDRCSCTDGGPESLLGSCALWLRLQRCWIEKPDHSGKSNRLVHLHPPVTGSPEEELRGFFPRSLGKWNNCTGQVKDWSAQHPVSWQHPVADARGRVRGCGTATLHLRGSNQGLSCPASAVCLMSISKSGTTTILGCRIVLMLNYCSIGLKRQSILPFLSDLPKLSGVDHLFDTWRTCWLFFVLDDMVSIVLSAFSQRDFRYSWCVSGL